MATYDITPLSSDLEFDTINSSCKAIRKFSGYDRVLVGWYQSTGVINVRSFNVNKTTGVITGIGTAADVEPSSGGPMDTGFDLELLSDSYAVIAWPGSGSDGYLRLVGIDTSGNVTNIGGAYEYDTLQGYTPSITKIDSTHFLLVWDGNQFDGYAQVISVNTSTGVFTKEGTALEFDTTSCYYPKTIQLDSTHFLVTYAGASNYGKSIILEVNLSTYAVTAASSIFTFQSAGMSGTGLCYMEDTGTEYRAVHITNITTTLYGYVLAVNKSTWAISTHSYVTLGAFNALTGWEISAQKVDDDTVLIFNRGTDSDGYAMTVPYNSSTGLGTILNTIEFYTTDVTYLSSPAANMGDGIYVMAWAGDANDGYIRAFSIELPPSGGGYRFNPQIRPFAGL